MPQQSDSGAASYAAPADFLKRYDARPIGQIARDDGTMATVADLLTDPNLAAALAEASGDVEMACLTGQRYEAADLAALTGNALEKLRGLVCDLAYVYFRRRRGVIEPPPPQYEEAQSLLRLLREGTEVWPLVESETAGLASTRPRTFTGDFDAGLIATRTRFFGLRQAYRGLGTGPADR